MRGIGNEYLVTHMEINVLIPGTWEVLDITKDDKGYSKPIISICESSKVIGQELLEAMLRAEEELLDPLIDVKCPSAASIEITPYWCH